jgi:quercetin dioxygenase-like cupin family protein
MMNETLIHRGTTLVRRMKLAPGEAMPWHQDPFHRVTVVLSGDALAIELYDGGETQHISIQPGLVDWDEPTSQVHRGVNVGQQTYEEVVVFFLDSPESIPQPEFVEGTTIPNSPEDFKSQQDKK